MWRYGKINRTEHARDKWALLLEPLEGKFNCFSISLQLCFGMVSVEWSMFLYILLHALVDIAEVIEGEHSAPSTCDSEALRF